jgi:hypothetical protein
MQSDHRYGPNAFVFVLLKAGSRPAASSREILIWKHYNHGFGRLASGPMRKKVKIVGAPTIDKSVARFA